MRTNIMQFLEDQSRNSLFNGRGDETNSGKFYMDCAAQGFFFAAVKAMVADGLDKSRLASILLDSAHRTAADGTSAKAERTARREIRDEVLRFHGVFAAVPASRKPSAQAGLSKPVGVEKSYAPDVAGFVSSLRIDEGASRQQVYRALTATLLSVMKAGGIDEDLRGGIRAALSDIAIDIDEDDPQDSQNKEAA